MKLALPFDRLGQSLKNMATLPAMLLALVAGALNVLAFAPFFLWPLQIFSLALLFLLWTHKSDWSLKLCFGIGASYGFGTMFAGVSWLLIIMTRYGGVPLPLAIIALTLFALYLSLYTAFALSLASYLRKRWRTSETLSLLLVLPALWLLFEYLRGIVLTGFPWLSLGYAHNTSPLAGFAPLFGVLGVGGMSALIAGALALMIVSAPSRKIAGGVILVTILLGFGLRQIDWTEVHGKPISVRLAQGNIDQGEKFDSAFLESTLAMYANMMTEKQADLIAIPETALPIVTSQLPVDYLSGLNAYAHSSGSRLVIGLAFDDGNHRYTNSVMGLGAEQGTNYYRYDKAHLVPFGEFIPYGFRWLIEMMRIPLGELATAEGAQAPMQVKDQWVLPNICYEDLFGDEIAKQLRMQAQGKDGAASILLNVSNLAWYGDSIAIPQHLQIAQMRTLETGRPMLRSTNTGATAIINAKGEVLAQLPSLTKGTLSGTVQGMQGLTPYIRFGSWPALAMAALALLGAYVLARRE